MWKTILDACQYLTFLFPLGGRQEVVFPHFTNEKSEAQREQKSYITGTHTSIPAPSSISASLLHLINL